MVIMGGRSIIPLFFGLFMIDFGERPKFLTSNASVGIGSTPVVRSELQNHHPVK